VRRFSFPVSSIKTNRWNSKKKRNGTQRISAKQENYHVDKASLIRAYEKELELIK
jgi:hypothetical protein